MMVFGIVVAAIAELSWLGLVFPAAMVLLPLARFPRWSGSSAPRDASRLDRARRAMTANGALQGKVSLVLGASKGIGAGTARAFGRAGATVVLASRDEQALDRVADEIRAAGARALVVPTDMGDEGQVASS